MIKVNDKLVTVLAAPLQGVTDNVWRMAHHEVFGGVDAYYAPFMRVEHGEVRRKDLRDVDPQRNTGTTLIPQILACQSDHALMMVNALRLMGYRRIDINLGCPFPPIALHRKGSGMMAHPGLVEELFTALAAVKEVEYSVKMRLGWDSNEQWRDILPLMDIIKPVDIAVHPRTGKQQYKGDLDMEQFEALLEASPWPLVYNGSLYTIQDIEQTIERYPTLAAVMVGSGLAANPGMFAPDATADDYRRFHDLLVDGYSELLNGGEAQLVRRLQDIWQTFLPGTGHKLFKAIRKSRTLDQYQNAAAAALADVGECVINSNLGIDMMKLNLITFASSLATRESVFTDHHELLDTIAAEYDVRYIFPEELDKPLTDGTTMVLVGSGGVEEMVKANIDRLPQYVVLIADGLKNSLAASLEILSWMRQNDRHGRVLHGSTGFIMQGIGDYAAAAEAVARLHGKRVGVIGKPSGWLIASNVDYTTMNKRWGIEMVDVPLDEVVTGYETMPDDEVQDITDRFIANAVGVKEPSRDEVVKAMRLYRAVKGIVEHYRLDAFTLNCFDLIPTTRTTGCVALALLNQEGIPAGCEGDEQTLLTMLAVQAATGQMTFMANPSKILDNAAHEMVFAHCTIAPAMTDRYIVRDHYESLSGVAVEGVFEPMDMTVVKCGGRGMERFFISRARLLQCTSNPNMCRTQLHLRLDEPLDYFLERSIGNHHVIVRGDHVERLTTVFQQLSAKS